MSGAVRHLLARSTGVLLVTGLVAGLAACGGGGGNSTAPPAARNFSIGGSVDGLAAGRNLTLQNNGIDSLALAGNGSFGFATRVAEGSAYAVTVAIQPQGQHCTVERSSGSALANVSDVAVVCSDVPVVSYRIGGTVSGLPGNGSVLVLRNNRLDFLDVSIDGSFRFNVPVAAGAAYAVVVQTLPAGQLCAVSNGVGTASADVNDVEVVCSAASAAPPGGVQSMAGTWLNGVCSAGAAGQSTRRLLRVTRQSDSSVAVSESTVVFATTTCQGSFTPGAFAPASLVTVRRTASTATTTATWAHWQPPTGAALYASLWHWRRNELCLKEGRIGDATDPETALPTAEQVEAHFAPVPSGNAACYVRL